jgi:hypothetical protein
MEKLIKLGYLQNFVEDYMKTMIGLGYSETQSIKIVFQYRKKGISNLFDIIKYCKDYLEKQEIINTMYSIFK